MNKFLEIAVHHFIPALAVVISILMLIMIGIPLDWALLGVVIVTVTVGQGALSLLVPQWRKQYTAGNSFLGMAFAFYISCFSGKYIAAIILVMVMWVIVVAVAAYCQNKGMSTRLS